MTYEELLKECEKHKAMHILYKSAFNSFVSASCEHDSDWLQEIDDKEVWPCEDCVQLHTFSDSTIFPGEVHELGVTCKRCCKTMCKSVFEKHYVDEDGVVMDDGEDFCAHHCGKCDNEFNVCLNCLLKATKETDSGVVFNDHKEICCIHNRSE